VELACSFSIDGTLSARPAQGSASGGRLGKEPGRADRSMSLMDRSPPHRTIARQEILLAQLRAAAHGW